MFLMPAAMTSSTIRVCLRGVCRAYALCVAGNNTVVGVCILYGEGSQQGTWHGRPHADSFLLR